MQELTANRTAELFKEAFGQAADVVVSAPGRVNLIGEHTDYNDGFVLPAAINYYTYIAAKKRDDRTLVVRAYNFLGESFSVDVDAPMQADPDMPWSNYVRGVIEQLKKANFKLQGGELFIAGNVPAGAGLSSSASLEMAVIRALLSLSNEQIDPKQAALLGQAAENCFVGCNCGIMDQLISACGEDKSALLIDCRDLNTRAVSIPNGWEILIVHSGVKRGLVDSEYNTRRKQCEAAAKFLGKDTLREVTLEELLAVKGQMPLLDFKRAHHVITENARTLVAADALKSADLPTLVAVMAESHVSMRDDFEITTPAIDTLVDILQTAGNGQAGARMTGGGFGGCVVALAPRAIIPQLEAAVLERYQAETGCEPTLIRALASAGAFHLSL